MVRAIYGEADMKKFAVLNGIKGLKKDVKT